MEALFLISGLVSFAGVLLLLFSRNAIYALIGLLIVFFGSAGVFLALDAPFLAVAQILVYAGALAVMFLFVLMFTDTRSAMDKGGPVIAVGSRVTFDPSEHKEPSSEDKPLPNPLDYINLPRPIAVLVAVVFFACMAFAVYSLPDSYDSFGELPASYDTGLVIKDEAVMVEYGTIEATSSTIFEGFPLAFEIVSLLIFAAVLGAVLLARKHLEGPSAAKPQDPENKNTDTGDAHNV
ncbi:MAG: NADH-quinone oxidoreductase subunit J [Planctomycetes bacterium]|nr:NADH-quinone oxidoreductase subunit J [Planctomycetota bacterium]